MTLPQSRLNIVEELDKTLNRKTIKIVISPVLEELQKISKEKGFRKSKQASLALALIKEFDIIKVEKHPQETVDDLIIRLAQEWICPVATNDRRLRKKLRGINISVIYLRQKSHLEVQGVIK